MRVGQSPLFATLRLFVGLYDLLQKTCHESWHVLSATLLTPVALLLVTQSIAVARQPTQTDQPDYQLHLPLVSSEYCGPYFDDFSNPVSGWPAGDGSQAWQASYAQDEYRLQHLEPGTALVTAPTCARWNYIVEADMRWSESPGPQIGIMLEQSQSAHSYILVSLDTRTQSLFFEQRVGSSGGIVTTHSAAIHKDSRSNHLRIVRDMACIHVEINGAHVGRFSVDRPEPGNMLVGIVSEADVDDVEARFDNFSYVSRVGDPCH